MCYISEMSPEDIFSTISQMKRILTRIVLVIAVMPAAVSCFNRSGKAMSKDPSTAVIDSLAAGEPFRLCEQTVTSIDALANITDTTSHSYELFCRKSSEMSLGTEHDSLAVMTSWNISVWQWRVRMILTGGPSLPLSMQSGVNGTAPFSLERYLSQASTPDTCLRHGSPGVPWFR